MKRLGLLCIIVLSTISFIIIQADDSWARGFEERGSRSFSAPSRSSSQGGVISGGRSLGSGSIGRPIGAASAPVMRSGGDAGGGNRIFRGNGGESKGVPAYRNPESFRKFDGGVHQFVPRSEGKEGIQRHEFQPRNEGQRGFVPKNRGEAVELPGTIQRKGSTEFKFNGPPSEREKPLEDNRIREWKNRGGQVGESFKHHKKHLHIYNHQYFKPRGRHHHHGHYKSYWYWGGYAFTTYFILDPFWYELEPVEFQRLYYYKGYYIRPLSYGCFEYSLTPHGPWEMRCPCFDDECEDLD